MKKIIVYSLLAAFVVCGCQVKEDMENTQGTQPKAKVFTAVIEDSTSGETKTSLDGSGNVLWKMGDQVSIFAASTLNEQYQVSDDSDGKTAATLNKVGGGGFVAGTEIDNNVAFYPYASTAEIAKSGGSYIISEIELPATQNYAAASFGNGAFPMTAVTSSTEDMNLKFKNVLGGLKLQLKGSATIEYISISGNNNEILCGDSEVTVTYGSTPSINLTDVSATTVTLYCGAGVTLDPEIATSFIIALPPMTMTDGFTVYVRDTEHKTMIISTRKPQTITRSSLLKMPVVAYEGIVLDWSNEPFSIISDGNTSVSIVKVDNPNDINLEVRKAPGGGWTPYTIGSSISLSDREFVQFRAGDGGNNSFSTIDGYYNIVVSGPGDVDVSGNIMSLLDRNMSSNNLPAYCFFNLFLGCEKIDSASDLKLPATTLAEYCYFGMFSDCDNLTSAPQLPATTLADWCYAEMFGGCNSLSTAPELPATTLASGCYANMFAGCTSLNTAPELPATTLAHSCYGYMFSGCTGLTTAPELTAEWVWSSGYSYMFKGCIGLTIAPALPAIYLDDSCYKGMFEGCTNLTIAPELPATELNRSCYESMFKGCTLLTTAPELQAETLENECYKEMFYGCTSLNYIKMLATDISASNCLNSWVYNVGATGTFVKSDSATWDITGASGIPSGWTVQTE